jgi:hypothetical protein
LSCSSAHGTAACLALCSQKPAWRQVWGHYSGSVQSLLINGWVSAVAFSLSSSPVFPHLLGVQAIPCPTLDPAPLFSIPAEFKLLLALTWTHPLRCIFEHLLF